MSVARRSRNGRSQVAKAAHPHERPDQDDPDHPCTVSAPLTDELRTIITTINTAAATWRDSLAVSIGRASALTGLKETQIRYFEEIGALLPEKTAGASRLYTLADLRRLYALALLSETHRPSEAATIVRAHARQIESGTHLELVDLLQQEGNAITDGFLLARLMSQLMDVAGLELAAAACPDTGSADVDAVAEAPPASHVRVIGLILPTWSAFADVNLDSFDAVQHAGRAIARAPIDLPVALDRGTIIPRPPVQIPPALNDAGRNDTTLLFYSREAWELPGWDRCQYCVYAPPEQPNRVMLLMVVVPDGVRIPVHLRPAPLARVILLDRLLTMCAVVFEAFRHVTPAKNYRYRSDGFQIEQTQQSYQQILTTICALIFPGDPGGMAVLFIPNSLDRPISLSVLAHQGYDEELAPRAKLDLAGEGQGLSGRAYNLREPFLSLDASTDPRMVSGVEGPCQTALAVPLATSWGITPFGVLYLASTSQRRALTSELAYVTLIFGNILSELLGRWWLTRLRRSLDDKLHRHVDEMIGWFDSLDQRSPDLERALDELERLWAQFAPAPKRVREGQLALAVLDIDTYRQRVQTASTAPIPLDAQRHVRAAIRKVVPRVRDFWFCNDHALLVLDMHDANDAAAIIRRIANQVRALPLELPGNRGQRVTLSISAAITSMTYQDLVDLDLSGRHGLREALRAIVDDLRQHTKPAPHAPGGRIQQLSATGWRDI